MKELEEKEGSILVPSTFPRDKERKDIAYDFYNFSEGDQSSEGSWASGKALDGEGEIRTSNTKNVWDTSIQEIKNIRRKKVATRFLSQPFYCIRNDFLIGSIQIFGKINSLQQLSEHLCFLDSM